MWNKSSTASLFIKILQKRQPVEFCNFVLLYIRYAVAHITLYVGVVVEVCPSASWSRILIHELRGSCSSHFILLARISHLRTAGAEVEHVAGNAVFRRYIGTHEIHFHIADNSYEKCNVPSTKDLMIRNPPVYLRPSTRIGRSKQYSR